MNRVDNYVRETSVVVAADVPDGCAYVAALNSLNGTEPEPASWIAASTRLAPAFVDNRDGGR